MLDKIKSLGADTAIYGVSTIVGRFLSFLLVPFYTNVLSTSHYGIVATVYSYIAFMNIIYIYGMESAYFKYASTREIGNDKQIFSTPFFSILITSVIFSCSNLFQQQLAFSNHRSPRAVPEYHKIFSNNSSARFAGNYSVCFPPAPAKSKNLRRDKNNQHRRKRHRKCAASFEISQRHRRNFHERSNCFRRHTSVSPADDSSDALSEICRQTLLRLC